MSGTEHPELKSSKAYILMQQQKAVPDTGEAFCCCKFRWGIRLAGAGRARLADGARLGRRAAHGFFHFALVGRTLFGGCEGAFGGALAGELGFTVALSVAAHHAGEHLALGHRGGVDLCLSHWDAQGQQAENKQNFHGKAG
jgi:hypothetical protein